MLEALKLLQSKCYRSDKYRRRKIQEESKYLLLERIDYRKMEMEIIEQNIQMERIGKGLDAS